jgi:hypothetical protein
LKRRLFNVSAAVSLLLCAAVLTLWVRSHRSVDLIGYTAMGWGGAATTMRGTLWFAVGDPAPRPGWTHQVLPADSMEIPGARTFAAVGWSTGAGWFPLGVPLWLFALACGYAAYRLLPRRPTPGQCAQCGYDLRATPDRCPECGAVAAQPAAA